MLEVKKIIEVTADADVFVVPNPLHDAVDMFQHRIEAIKHDAVINGVIDFSALKFVELWIASDDLASQNVCDHGCHIPIGNDQEVTIYPGEIYSMFPTTIFNGKKEGDEVPWTFICSGYEGGNRKTGIVVQLNLRMHLCQQKYRYKSFGNFEDVVHRLGANID